MTYTIKFTTPFDQVDNIKVEANSMGEAVHKSEEMADICQILTVEVEE